MMSGALSLSLLDVVVSSLLSFGVLFAAVVVVVGVAGAVSVVAVILPASAMTPAKKEKLSDH